MKPDKIEKKYIYVEHFTIYPTTLSVTGGQPWEKINPNKKNK